MMSRVWGRHAPTRSLGKLARVWEVKSRMDRKFSRIENLWPRDGSCPLPLRSKSFPGNCFWIVKTQKISRGTLLMYGSRRLLRTKFLPLFVQRRWRKVGITSSRLMKFSRYNSHKEKYRPRSAAMILSGEVSGKMNRVCCGAVNLLGIIHGEAVFRMNTTTSCEWLLTNPQNQWDLWQRISWFVGCVKMILQILLQ